MIYWYSILALICLVGFFFSYKSTTISADGGMAYAVMAVFAVGVPSWQP